jgi:hypothetical protein
MEEVKNDQPTDNAAEKQDVSMADVAKKYNVDKMSVEFTAKPAATTAQPQPVSAPVYTPPIPDPITQSDDFAKYQLQQQQYVTGTLRELGEQVQEMSKRAQQAELDAEVNQAVGKVSSKLPGVDKTYTEILLEKRYRDDPIFKSIWDNRKLNPKAVDEALEVITNEAKGVFQVKVDPQLQENIRAAKASTSTKAVSNRADESDPTANMNEAEFDRWWNQQKRGF